MRVLDGELHLKIVGTSLFKMRDKVELTVVGISIPRTTVDGVVTGIVRTKSEVFNEWVSDVTIRALIPLNTL